MMFPAVTAVLIVYAVFILWMRRGLQKLEPGSSQTVQPDVSVIIAAKDEALNIPRLLAALREQSYPRDRLEVIVVDDGSSDDTHLILSLQARKMNNLKSVRIDSTPTGWGPKKWALTKAIGQARGEIILATDADCLPGSRWVETLVRYFTDPSIGMVFGPSPLVVERRNLWWEALFLDSCAVDALAAAGAGCGLALTCTGRNLAYRRAAFEEVGGFQGVKHFVSGDDDLLMQKMAATGRWKINFAHVTDALVPSPPPATLGAFVRQRLRFASKGRYYFVLDTGPWFKLILPFIYLANLAALTSLLVFPATLNPVWIVPLAVKLGAEGLLVYSYLHRINQRVRVGTFILTGLIHPVYVVLFGALGNMRNVVWKGRRYEGSRVSARRK